MLNREMHGCTSTIGTLLDRNSVIMPVVSRLKFEIESVRGSEDHPNMKPMEG